GRKRDAAARTRRPRRRARTRPGGARRRRLEPAPPSLSAPAFRRRAAARGAGARVRAPAADLVRGRADRKSGPAHRPRGRRSPVRIEPYARHHAGAGDARSCAGRALRRDRAARRRTPERRGAGMRPLAFAWPTLRREFRYGELATLGAALVLAVAALGAVATL